MDLDRVKLESASQTPAGSVNLAENPSCFMVFTDIPSRRDKTFTV
jgi:hypothetical protein